ncbi:MAG: DUF5723 family protein, partial [Bacteroidia bacterium]
MNSFSWLQANFTRKQKKCFPVLIFAICNLQSAICNSQNFLGYINSDYAGVNGIDLNPACIVNSPRKWDVSVIGLNVEAANNFLGFQKRALDHSGGTTSGNYPAFNDQNFATDYLTQRSGIRSVSVFAAANISLPSFMFTRKKHKDAFAFTCRTRAYVNVDGIDPTLANIFLTGGANSSLYNQNLASAKVSVQAMVWNEYGITYGKTIEETSNERLNVAGRIKLLQGLDAVSIYIKNVNYKLDKKDSVVLVSALVDYGHSSNLDNQPPVSLGFGGKPSVGLDIGATYEFHPLTDVHSRLKSESKTTPMQHKYRYKIGFSIQDIGWITYLKSSNARDFTVPLNNPPNVNSLGTSGSHPLASLDDSLKKQFSMTGSDTKFRMILPAVASLQGDYYAGRNIFVNSTVNFAPQFANSPSKIHEITMFSIAPRWDWKWIGTYFPVSYDKYSHLRAGFSLRLGPLIIGTANLLPLITKKDIYGFDFHFLLKVPHIAFNRKNKNPNARSQFDVNREQPKKARKQKQPKSDMPTKDVVPPSQKESKPESITAPVQHEKKTRKHIF